MSKGLTLKMMQSSRLRIELRILLQTPLKLLPGPVRAQNRCFLEELGLTANKSGMPKAAEVILLCIGLISVQFVQQRVSRIRLPLASILR
jgi:hypothetical protein